MQGDWLGIAPYDSVGIVGPTKWRSRAMVNELVSRLLLATVSFVMVTGDRGVSQYVEEAARGSGQAVGVMVGAPKDLPADSQLMLNARAFTNAVDSVIAFYDGRAEGWLRTYIDVANEASKLVGLVYVNSDEPERRWSTFPIGQNVPVVDLSVVGDQLGVKLT